MHVYMRRNTMSMGHGVVMHSGREVGTYRLASREGVHVHSRRLLKNDEVWVVDFTVKGKRYAGAGTRPCYAMIAAQEG
jgi:hypothetical protein